MVVVKNKLKHFSPLGIKLYFQVNFSRTNFIVFSPTWPSYRVVANQELKVFELQSTLPLRTPRYCGRNALAVTDKIQLPGKSDWGLTENDPCY